MILQLVVTFMYRKIESNFVSFPDWGFNPIKCENLWFEFQHTTQQPNCKKMCILMMRITCFPNDIEVTFNQKFSRTFNIVPYVRERGTIPCITIENI